MCVRYQATPNCGIGKDRHLGCWIESSGSSGDRRAPGRLIRWERYWPRTCAKGRERESYCFRRRTGPSTLHCCRSTAAWKNSSGLIPRLTNCASGANESEPISSPPTTKTVNTYYLLLIAIWFDGLLSSKRRSRTEAMRQLTPLGKTRLALFEHRYRSPLIRRK